MDTHIPKEKDLLSTAQYFLPMPYGASQIPPYMQMHEIVSSLWAVESGAYANIQRRSAQLTPTPPLGYSRLPLTQDQRGVYIIAMSNDKSDFYRRLKKLSPPQLSSSAGRIPNGVYMSVVPLISRSVGQMGSVKGGYFISFQFIFFFSLSP